MGKAVADAELAQGTTLTGQAPAEVMSSR
jgi:hypothetical protein